MIIPVNQQFGLDEHDLQFTAMRAGGPGGQHVNTTDSAIRLSLNLYSARLPEPVRQRLLQRNDHRIQQGVVQIVCQQHRSQKRNREAALQRLIELLRSAAKPPKHRRRTRPSRSSIERRLTAKKQHSQRKGLRKKVPHTP